MIRAGAFALRRTTPISGRAIELRSVAPQTGQVAEATTPPREAQGSQRAAEVLFAAQRVKLCVRYCMPLLVRNLHAAPIPAFGRVQRDGRSVEKCTSPSSGRARDRRGTAARRAHTARVQAPVFDAREGVPDCVLSAPMTAQVIPTRQLFFISISFIPTAVAQIQSAAPMRPSKLISARLVLERANPRHA